MRQQLDPSTRPEAQRDDLPLSVEDDQPRAVRTIRVVRLTHHEPAADARGKVRRNGGHERELARIKLRLPGKAVETNRSPEMSVAAKGDEHLLTEAMGGHVLAVDSAAFRPTSRHLMKRLHSTWMIEHVPVLIEVVVEVFPAHHLTGVELAALAAVVARDQSRVRIEDVPVRSVELTLVRHRKRQCRTRLVEEAGDVEAGARETADPLMRALLCIRTHDAILNSAERQGAMSLNPASIQGGEPGIAIEWAGPGT